MHKINEYTRYSITNLRTGTFHSYYFRNNETDIQNYCHTLKALKCNENSTCNLK